MGIKQVVWCDKFGANKEISSILLATKGRGAKCIHPCPGCSGRFDIV